MVTRRLLATGLLVLLTAASSRAHSQPLPRNRWLEGGWKGYRYEQLRSFVESSAGPIVGVDLGSGQVSAGYGARIGFRERDYAEDSVPFGGVMFGEVRSLEVTFRAFRGDAGPPRFFVGLSLTTMNFIAANYEHIPESRLRGPTVLGVALPEVGFWFPADGFAAPYLSYSAPFAYLVSEHVAVELRPSLTITFHQDSARTDLHGWLSTALLWR